MLKRRARQPINELDNSGFTIIETLIVLAIAGLMFLVVFVAYPTMARERRNRQRYNEAVMVYNAVFQCLSNNNNNVYACDSTNEVDFNVEEFEIFTEYEYGRNDTLGYEPNPINVDGPVWLFNTYCQRPDWVAPSNNLTDLTVSFVLEKPNGGILGRCLDDSR